MAANEPVLAAVREAMAEELEDGELSLAAEVDGKPLHAHLFGHASSTGDEHDTEAGRAFVAATLDRLRMSAKSATAAAG